MTQAITLLAVTPQAGVSGGHVTLACAGLDPQALAACRIVFGASATRPMLATPTLLLGVIAEGTAIDNVHIVQGEQQSNTMPFTVATRLADNLHPVASPAVDAQGNIYTTISGTKDQRVPVSLYRISPQGEVVPLPATIANPTSLAFGPDGILYISSRHEGTVYRMRQQGTADAFATDLGIATGLAFDAQGRLYVGDRRGTILQIDENGTSRVFARLVPTMTGYHLAFADDGCLYVSFPTLSASDQISRITPDGEVQPFVGGLGRAQGIAFDTAQNLYVVAHYEGEGGVVCITPAGVMTRVVAGVNLVGLAFGTHGDLILTDNSTVYKLAFGVQGRLSPA
jgi:sugar lactone lactonase YvrE